MSTPETYFMVARERNVMFIREVFSTNNSSIRLTKRQAFELAKYRARPCPRSQNPHVRQACTRFVFINTDNVRSDLPADKFLPARGEEFPSRPTWWTAENLNSKTGYYGDAPAHPQPEIPARPVVQATQPAANLSKFLS